MGRSSKDGPIFKCSDPTTQGVAAEEWEGLSSLEGGQPIKVEGWHNLHFRQERTVDLSVYRVSRPQATNKQRDPQVSWFIWVGAGGAKVKLEEVWATYRRRYSMEHNYRYAKQDLLWSGPKVRQPQQLQLWTDLVTVVEAQMLIGKELVKGLRQPWEQSTRQRAVTPRQVRRELGRIISELGSEAAAVQVRGKGPGRAAGAVVKRAERHKVVRKAVTSGSGRHRPDKTKKEQRK